jgi:hypothetical protein
MKAEKAGYGRVSKRNWVRHGAAAVAAEKGIWERGSRMVGVSLTW